MDLPQIGLLFKEARKRSRRTPTALLETVGLDLVFGPRKTRPTLDDLRAERRKEKGRG